MIRLEIGLEIRHSGVMSLCAIEDKTAVVVVASYRSVSRNPVPFKALPRSNSWPRSGTASACHLIPLFSLFNALVQHYRRRAPYQQTDLVQSTDFYLKPIKL